MLHFVTTVLPSEILPYKEEKPLIKVVAVVDYGHWNFMPAAQLMWDYFKMFSRDPETKKLIYHGEE